MREINKLVRDRVPEDIESEGREVVFDYYKSYDLVEAMLDKVVEEANEVKETKTTEELISELGDLLDITHSLIDELELNDSVDEARRHKREKLGTFSKGVKLIKTN